MRIFKNLKWLFNHPPVSIKEAADRTKCDYCGGVQGVDDIGGIWEDCGVGTICMKCKHEVYRKVLGKKEKK